MGKRGEDEDRGEDCGEKAGVWSVGRGQVYVRGDTGMMVGAG